MTQADLRKLAVARLKDAEVLIKHRRYDGARYLCGYVVELALKSRICRTLKLNEYPESRAYQSFKTHSLDTLLHLSGREVKIKTVHLPEWSFVVDWDPSVRYQTLGTATASDAKDMRDSARVLLKAL